jgi:putative transcriptional regulator
MLSCKLRLLMAERKIDDVAEVMRLSGLSRPAVQKLYREQGLETVKLDTYIKICDALGCTLNDLVQYKPVK